MKYFVTFGQRYAREPHPTFPAAHPDGWLEIEAPNYAAANQAAHDFLGSHFALLYEERNFDPSFFPRGPLPTGQPE